MKTIVTEILLINNEGNPDGVGQVWETREGVWSFAHPNGADGFGLCSFEAAVAELEAISRGEYDSCEEVL